MCPPLEKASQKALIGERIIILQGTWWNFGMVAQLMAWACLCSFCSSYPSSCGGSGLNLASVTLQSLNLIWTQPVLIDVAWGLAPVRPVFTHCVYFSLDSKTSDPYLYREPNEFWSYTKLVFPARPGTASSCSESQPQVEEHRWFLLLIIFKDMFL